ncbi:MAG: phosphoglycerate dehydrogenase [Candidatus Methanospirare jalkutatii]|nr:phosphoglycerate dehydrogenase [Candidatus Methanospirare jalkutatii]
MRWRVLVTDPLAEEGIKRLSEFADVSVAEGLSSEELKAKIGEYDALVVRSGTKVTADVIYAASRLKVVGRAGVGVDNIDVEAATEKGILVVNAPEANTISAAEHTIALILALARKIPSANASLKAGKWERKKHMGVELNGKTLGILGLGRVGTEVAKRAKAFGMKILAYDPYISAEKALQLGVSLLPLEEVLRRSDFISLHTPLTKETYHLLDRDAFEKMKDGVRIINCARGGIIDEDALVEAIKSGKVAGAALDVFEEEPPSPDSELLRLENVIVTPHLGASTEEAQRTAALVIAEEIERALRGEPVRYAVNMPYLQEEQWDALRPFLTLASKLGSLCAQLKPKLSRIEHLEFAYEGKIGKMDKETSMLTAVALKSMLSFFTSGVNIVNARVIARKMGIKVSERKTEEAETFPSLLSISMRTEDGNVRTVSGTLFEGEPRVVKIDGYRVDAVPSGFMLVCSFLDKPRVIGPVCTILGDHRINIAGMQVGRKERGGEAVMVLNVDSDVDDAVLEEIKKVPNILDVKSVKL